MTKYTESKDVMNDFSEDLNDLSAILVDETRFNDKEEDAGSTEELQPIY